jgi:magnesium transporter
MTSPTSPPREMTAEFDFQDKRCRVIRADEAAASCARGLGCWLDLDAGDPAHVAQILRGLGVNALAIEQVTEHPELDGRHDIYDDCVHVTVSAVRCTATSVEPSYVNIIIGQRFIVTVHPVGVEFLEHIRRTYVNDFQRYAETLSFLLFEVFSHLLESYRSGLRVVSGNARRLQALIFQGADDQIFALAGDSMRGTMSFRGSMVSARGVVYQLSTRRSPFVSEATRPFLENMVGSLERLGGDLDVERDILGETLSLYMGIVGHRTNRVVNRLTALSAIFLPLTFLCGVYGMNFRDIPELSWRFGYPLFWAVALGVAGGLTLCMRRWRWV